MSQHVSAYVPHVAFRNDAQNRLWHSFIKEQVEAFFRHREIFNPVEIAPREAITELDFPHSGALPFDYFYKVVMQGVKKEKGKIDHVAYTLTFDPELTSHTCERTGIPYGYLSLGEHPVLYYLRLELSKLLALLRQHSFEPKYE